MIKESEKLSKNMDIEILILEVFENNKRALHVYNKLGYTKIGSIIDGFKLSNKYYDKIIMMKNIKY